jgi:hypothetical protein
MKKHVNTIAAIGLLVFIALACNANFTTANISSFNFGKNNKAEPPTTTFDLGDKIFAVAMVSNTSSKHKMKFKVFSKDKEVLTKDVDFEGSRPVFLELTVPAGGEYKIEAALLDDSGKEIDKKSGTVTVKGGASTTSNSTDKQDTAADDEEEDNK